jgi:hypothetical protein
MLEDTAGVKPELEVLKGDGILVNEFEASVCRLYEGSSESGFKVV